MATPRHPLAGEPVGEPCPGQRALTAAVAAAPSPFLSLSSFLSFFLFISLSRTFWCRKLSGTRYSIRNALLEGLFNRGGKVVLGEDQRERGKKILSIRLDLDFDLKGLYGGWRKNGD